MDTAFDPILRKLRVLHTRVLENEQRPSAEEIAAGIHEIETDLTIAAERRASADGATSAANKPLGDGNSFVGNTSAPVFGATDPGDPGDQDNPTANDPPD